MKVAVIYYKFYDRTRGEAFIGGAEHYIYRLTKICSEQGLEPIVFQLSSEPFDTLYEHVRVVGVKPGIKLNCFCNTALYQAALEVIDPAQDLLIFGADICSVRTDNPRCLSINHGLFWDYPTSMGGPYPYRLKGVVGSIYKKYKKLMMLRKFDNCPNRICVDHNFVNWYRTAINELPVKKITVIPNFSNIADPSAVAHARRNGEVRILFARRFSEYRGTRLMAEAVRRILLHYQQVSVTFAGDGPDEPYLKDLFREDTRVAFSRFGMNEAMSVNLQHDICVVPSLAAEGTSLSVAEAMGAGRAVVATNVGGITNMIIDGYNGVLITPDADSLTCALELLINDPDLRHRLGSAAYETARCALSFERWEKAWVRVLKEYI